MDAPGSIEESMEVLVGCASCMDRLAILRTFLSRTTGCCALDDAPSN